MKAKVPEAIFKKAAVSSADAPPMLDMTAVQKAWCSCSSPAARGNLERSKVKRGDVAECDGQVVEDFLL